MHEEPKLSAEEWALVTELLEHEGRELPSEIHHTSNADVRAELQRRLEMVRQLLARLHQSAEA